MNGGIGNADSFIAVAILLSEGYNQTMRLYQIVILGIDFAIQLQCCNNIYLNIFL